MSARKPTPMDQLTTAYQEYADNLLKYCCYRMRNTEDAKEVVHDTFVKAHEFLDRGNTVGDLKNFLFRIANNLIVDRARKLKHQNEQEVPLDVLREKGVHPMSTCGNEMVQSKIEAEQIIAATKTLGQSDQILFALRYVDGLTPTEIASLTNSTSNNVSVRLHRILKRLSHFMNTRPAVRSQARTVLSA